ncbi:MAG TPA: phosphoribosylanthranilate isomerase [Bacteroidales bacterium]|nr:phosphoribosylanthranilate isomerase [Bacteroidales bacterium]
MTIKIRVCGMRDPQNIQDIVQCNIDILGFIFYEQSQRFVGHDFSPQLLLDCGKQTAGVFVNQSVEYVVQKQQTYGLDYLQIHGNESVEYCRQLYEITQAYIVKAFLIDEHFSDSILEEYAPYCHYFLFDTKTTMYGGSGQKFDWNILRTMNISKPFFLSGGITPQDTDILSRIQHPKLYCIDINSKFEIRPAYKNVEVVRYFVTSIQ